MSNVLGRMRNIPQWFLWRLTWDEVKKKYDKKPCALDGSQYNIDHSLPSNWHSHAVASSALLGLQALHQPGAAQTYALGFYLTAECGLWFFDLDNAVVDGAVVPLAAELVQRFPGALVEWSSSNRGIHVIGSGAVPEHRTKPPKHIKERIAPLELEFYNHGRGIAFGFQLDSAHGSADTIHDCRSLVTEYFQPDAKLGTGGSQRRAEWNGPEDDDALIERFMRSNQSAASLFGGKVSLQQLWRGECEHTNDNDMSLAAHLAFWTGCDGDRIERLMRRSGLVRDKWDTHRTYLRELTIEKACASCESVYAEPVSGTVVCDSVGEESGAPMQIVTPQTTEQVRELKAMIDACGTLDGIFNDVIPAIQAAGVPACFVNGLALKVNKKLDFFGEKMSLPSLRQLLSPDRTSVKLAGDAPEWMQRHCFVKASSTFMDMLTGSESDKFGFDMEWSRMMPMKPQGNGKRESPSEWAAHRWNIVTVDDKMYHPLMGPIFEWAGKTYANVYRADSVPKIEEYTADVVEQINAFNAHMLMLCGRREEVYWKILHWLAHNVQYPGRKIRWSPLIKGVPGDGKSIIADVMRAAMGMENVKMTSPSVLENSGGFTDWATGRAVNFIEEIRLVGPARHKLFNAMKVFIDNMMMNNNNKGGKIDRELPNVTNHGAFTNFNDGIPVDDTDRRWMVVVSPNSDIMDAVHERGFTSVEALVGYFKKIGESCRAHPGQWRAWLLAIDTRSFDPDGRAPLTDEKLRMAATSRDSTEEILHNIIEEGGVGIHKDVFCSSILSATVKNRALMDASEVPRSTAWNQILARMGYEKLVKVMKWNGQTHTVWAKSKFASDLAKVREILDSTSNPKANL